MQKKKKEIFNHSSDKVLHLALEENLFHEFLQVFIEKSLSCKKVFLNFFLLYELI